MKGPGKVEPATGEKQKRHENKEHDTRCPACTPRYSRGSIGPRDKFHYSQSRLERGILTLGIRDPRKLPSRGSGWLGERR